MKFPWLKKRIEEIVDGHLLNSRVWKDLDERIKNYIKQLDSTKAGLSDAKQRLEETAVFLKAVAEITVPFDLEAQLDEFAEKLEVKPKVRRAAYQYSLRTHIIYRFGRDITLTKIGEDKLFWVRPDCDYCLLGIKFIKGDGYGKYAIYKGRFVERLTEFTRAKAEKGISIAFPLPNTLYFYPDYIFGIRREEGKGQLTVALIGYSAKPFAVLSAIKEEETTKNEA